MPRLGIWPDLGLRTKGLIVIAFPAAATVLIACASYILGARAGGAEQAVRRSHETSLEIQRLKGNEAEASAHVRAYFLTGDVGFAAEARQAIADFDATLQKLTVLAADDASQARRVSEIAALQRARVEHIFAATTLFQSGSLTPEALRDMLREKEAERLRMETVLDAMQSDQVRLLGAQSRDVRGLQRALRASTGVCVFLGVVGGVVISLLFASGITNRIRKLQENVSRLASGALPDPLPGGRDEIGVLAQGIAQAAELLRQRTGALEHALHGIAQVDGEGRYLSFNKAYAELACISECNKPANLLLTMHQDDRSQVQAAIDRMRNSGRAETEVRIADAFGSIIDVAMSLLPVSGDPNSGYYVFLHDITQRKETEAALVRAKDEALASSLAKNDFLAKISHDIRTPLNAILGAANLLSETSLTPIQSEHVNMFQRNCARLVKLINDFLDFSKIEAGALKLEKIPFRIRGTIEDAVATFRESALRKGIALEYEIARDVPDWGLGDPLRVQQVLVNLLSNAVKFTENGQVSVEVLRTSGASGPQLLFEVSDSGPGIGPEDQKRVFGAFTQLSKGAAAGGGSGLGLTICRELVGRMGGEVGLTSELGVGSKFYFTFPLEEADPVESILDRAPGPAAMAAAANGVIRVLVAEDTEDNRLLISHYLRKEPFEVEFAADGQEALDAIQAGGQFDLILMDLDMPRLDGYQATKSIREWEKSHGAAATPIVALSAHAMREAEIASLSAGCAAHVAKPVEQVMLVGTIRRYARSKGPRLAMSADVADGVAALVPKYLASKAAQVQEARASLAAKDFEPIRRFGHNLKGTGRGYGFPPIEDMGQAIEKAAAVCDEAGIAQQLENLQRFLTSELVPSWK